MTILMTADWVVYLRLIKFLKRLMSIINSLIELCKMSRDILLTSDWFIKFMWKVFNM